MTNIVSSKDIDNLKILLSSKNFDSIDEILSNKSQIKSNEMLKFLNSYFFELRSFDDPSNYKNLFLSKYLKNYNKHYIFQEDNYSTFYEYVRFLSFNLKGSYILKYEINDKINTILQLKDREELLKVITSNFGTIHNLYFWLNNLSIKDEKIIDFFQVLII